MKKWKILGMVTVLAAALAVAGCSDDGDGPTGGGDTDTTPPGIASVTAVDQNHVDVEFDETVTRASAERREHYVIVEQTPTGAAALPVPNDTIHVETASLDDDGVTVHLTTSDFMQNAPYELTVAGVQDASGNTIEEGTSQSFTGTTNADVTAPTVVYRSPAPGETGVGRGQSVIVQFSEPMDFSSVVDAFSWTFGGGSVAFEVEEQQSTRFYFRPLAMLSASTTYTASLDGTAQDLAGNPLSPTSWNFTTTSQTDNTPPTLMSSTPADGAVNVSVSTNLSLTFSEPIEPSSLQDVFISPEVGSGVETWSNGGRTVTFDPDNDLMFDTQYSLLIIPGGVRDLAGNGNTDAISIKWSTGPSLATGGFAGTLTGPSSADVDGPEGATVIAADRNPFGSDDDFYVGGTGTAVANGDYSVSNLPQGTWWPLAAMDSNRDGNIDPETGDAFGLYGVDFKTMTGEPDTVVVGSAVVTGIDFPVYDPMAISGAVNYIGSTYPGCCYTVYVGVFDTTGFDIGGPLEPDYGTEAYWPGDPRYAVSEFDYLLAEGTYYVGAYLDGNSNGTLDASDPIGFYGGMTPTPVTIAGGTDALDINITLDDPATFTATGWAQPQSGERPAAELFRRVLSAIHRAQGR